MDKEAVGAIEGRETGGKAETLTLDERGLNPCQTRVRQGYQAGLHPSWRSFPCSDRVIVPQIVTPSSLVHIKLFHLSKICRKLTTLKDTSYIFIDPSSRIGIFNWLIQ